MDVTNLMKHCEKCDVYFVETCCCEEVGETPQCEASKSKNNLCSEPVSGVKERQLTQ